MTTMTYDYGMSVEEIEAIDPATNDRMMVRALRHTATWALQEAAQATVCTGHFGRAGWIEKVTAADAALDGQVARAKAAYAKILAIFAAHPDGVPQPQSQEETAEEAAQAVAVSEDLGAKALSFMAYAQEAGWHVHTATRESDIDTVSVTKEGPTITAQWDEDAWTDGTLTRGDGSAISLRNASDARKAVDGTIS